VKRFTFNARLLPKMLSWTVAMHSLVGQTFDYSQISRKTRIAGVDPRPTSSMRSGRVNPT
jgi:hypothetical protein